MEIKTILNQLLSGHDLRHQEMIDVMTGIMTGQFSDAQIAGFLIALRTKGETVDEIAAAARVMRELSSRVSVNESNLIDTCGTGGDGANTFNISTTTAFVAAAAGAHVAKHGNRSVSSQSGSADLLEKAGVNLELNPEQVASCISSIGIGFMFAPLHHSAMKYAIGPRKELGVRTIFNLLGPLTNPASAPHQLLGVFDRQWLLPMAEVLQQLGSQHVLVVHSEDGLDEISLSAATYVAELKDNTITQYQITPEQFGFEKIAIDTLAVTDTEHSYQTVMSVLENRPGPALDIVCLNAGAAIYTSGLSDDIGSGIEKARDAIASGAAKDKLLSLVTFTNDIQ